MPNYRVIAPYDFTMDVLGVPPTTWRVGAVYEIPVPVNEDDNPLLDDDGDPVDPNPNPANFEATDDPATPLDENRNPVVEDELDETPPAKPRGRGKGGRRQPRNAAAADPQGSPDPADTPTDTTETEPQTDNLPEEGDDR